MGEKNLSSNVISSPVFPYILTCSLCVYTELSLLALAVWIECLRCTPQTSLVLYILACAGALGGLSDQGSHKDKLFWIEKNPEMVCFGIANDRKTNSSH